MSSENSGTQSYPETSNVNLAPAAIDKGIFRRAWEKVRIPAYMATGPILGLIGISSLIASKDGTSTFRDQIPEPFDVFDHVGNAGYPYIIGMVATAVGVSGFEEISKREAFGIAFSLASMANLLIESPVSGGQFDKLDLLYGLAGTIIGIRTAVVLDDAYSFHSE